VNEETFFENDFDESCARIKSTVQTLILLYRFPQTVVQQLRAIAADAEFLRQFAEDAERLDREADCPMPDGWDDPPQ